MKTPLSLLVIGFVLLLATVVHRGSSSCAAAADAAPAPQPAASGKTNPSDKPAASGKAEKPAKSDPAAVSSQPAPTRTIRYGWKPGYSYTYRVKANTQRPDSDEDIEGTVTYKVTSLDADGVADVTCIESFTRCQRSGGLRSDSSSLHHSTHQQLTTVSSAPERIKIDKQGRIVSDQRRGNAPFPIGHLSRLAIEPLSALDEKGWTVDSERKIVLRPMTDDPPSLRDYGEEGAILAREKSRYTIKGTEGKKLLIRKTYEFATVAEENGQVRLTVSGEGDLTFDQEAEVFGSSTMTTEVRLRDGGDLLQEATKVQSGLIRVTQEPSAPQPGPAKAQVRQSGQGSF